MRPVLVSFGPEDVLRRLHWIVLLLAASMAGAGAHAQSISNLSHRVDSQPNGSLLITETATGASATFQPNFRILYSSASPGWKMYSGDVRATEYTVMGFYPMIWQNNPDFFSAPGTNYLVAASSTLAESDSLRWVFAGTNGIAVDALVSLPPGAGEPVLSFELTAGASGYYSIGYVGAPERTTNQVDWIFQPLFWTDKRIPSTSFCTPESHCTIPAVLSGYGDQTVGLAVDPGSLYSPYADPGKRLLDTTSGYPGRFGLVLRNEAGNVQPMVFAPVYGQSSLAAGGKVSTQVRLVVRQGQWYDSYKYLATSLYSFSNYRTNAGWSLNTTIDNLTDFIQGPYGHWIPRYKNWDYLNDKPGYGRQQSAADSISLAIVKDDLALFTNIARPTLEYMLSRGNAIFPLADTNEPPTSTMGRWIGDTYQYGGTEMAAAYLLSGRRSTVIYTKLLPILRTTAVTGANNLTIMRDAIGDLLSNYRLTGNIAYLNAAKTTAESYISARFGQRPTGRADAEGSFFTQIGGAWQLLNEMYDETGDPVYRDMFIRSMREFTAFIALSPPSPPGNITLTNYLTGFPESVPAWRADFRGFMREAGPTSHSHVGIHMPPFASYMLRAAHYADDDFLKAVARSTVIGRYANYPGYAYRRHLTHSYSLVDWPHQDYSVIRSYITMHFNHPLPMTTYLIEFLLADAAGRSSDQIEFPSCYTWTGAYFNHKVYGAEPGVFYGDTNVFLWMPKSLVTNSSPQIDYVSGYGNGNFYLALMNQSSNAVTTQVSINAAKVDLAGSHTARVIVDNVEQSPTTIIDGTLTLNVSGMGITALVISNAAVNTALHALYYEPNPVPIPAGCYQTRSGTPVGNVSSQILSFGRQLTSAYVSLSYDTNNLTRATLHYETNGVWHSMLKPEFPFEFTVPLPDNETSFHFYVEGLTPSGAIVSNAPVQLGYQLSVQSPQGPGSAATSAIYDYGQGLTVTAPASVTVNSVEYLCTGWSMQGHTPSSGGGNSLTFSITNDATLVWHWEKATVPGIDAPSYLLKLAVTNYNRSQILTNFPLLVVLGTNLSERGFNYAQFLSPHGHDLRFSDATLKNFFNYEIARWNTNGGSHVWVQVPQLSSNTTIYASWGDPANNTPYPSLFNGATWSNGYEAVWHFGETPGGDNVVYDSTANARHGLAHNMTAVDQWPWFAGGSLDFNGTTEFISLNSELVLPSAAPFTFSAWVRPEGTTPYPGITAPSASPGYTDSLRLFAGTPRFNIAGGNKLFLSPTPRDGATWTCLAVTRAAGGVFNLYQNGTNDTGAATSSTAAFPIAYLGRGMETNDTTRNWNGGLAEIRVSNVERSPDWIWAEYQTAAGNKELAHYGATQPIPPLWVEIEVEGPSVRLIWPGAENFTYSVEYTSNLASGFLPLATDLPATPPLNALTNTPPAAASHFYRVKAQLQD